MKYIIVNTENYVVKNEYVDTDKELDDLLETKQIANIRVIEIAREVKLKHSPGVVRVEDK